MIRQCVIFEQQLSFVLCVLSVMGLSLTLPPPLDSSLKVSQVVKGEMSAKTTYQRSAKGPLSVCECGGDGRFVALENTGRKVSHGSKSKHSTTGSINLSKNSLKHLTHSITTLVIFHKTPFFLLSYFFNKSL